MMSIEQQSLSKLGIQLRFLLDWAQEKRISFEATTADVCFNIVIPETKTKQLSYCEYLLHLQSDRESNAVVGEASVFISHAWKYKFIEVLNALEAHFSSEPDIIIWFDIFSNNQHKTLDLDFNWWATTFKSAIISFGRTVMVLAPWNDPIPLTRGWCVWELYCSILGKEEGSRFEIALSSESESQFVHDMDNNAVVLIGKMLVTINCRNSQCTKTEDPERIQTAIENTIGHLELNKAIFELIGDWVIKRYSEESESRSANLGKTHKSTIISLNNLALLYRFQGKYELGEEMLQECLQLLEATLGKTHPDTLTTMNNLASSYTDRGGRFIQGMYKTPRGNVRKGSFIYFEF